MSQDFGGSRPLPALAKVVLALALVLFIVAQGWVLLGSGGIMSKYTFVEGFTAFGDLMLKDPLTTAGLMALIVYPGLAALGYLLLYWRRWGQFRP